MWYINLVPCTLLLSTLLSVNTEECPAEYLRFHPHHIFCRPSNSECAIYKKGVAHADIDKILRIHNDIRSKVANGQVSSVSSTTVANMLEMVWDDELATLAQKRSEVCYSSRDCEACRMTLSYPSEQYSRRVNLEESTEMEADWDWLNLTYSLSEMLPEDVEVRATTWTIGCGWTAIHYNGRNESNYVCNYGKPEYVQSDQTHIEGPPCSKCPENSCCGESCGYRGVSAKYLGLCKVVLESQSPEGNSREPDDIFHCSFHSWDDCRFSASGKGKWIIQKTRGGNYLSLTLTGGNSVIVKFLKPFSATSEWFCFTILARRTPAIAGQNFGSFFFSIFDFDGNRPMILETVEMQKEHWQHFTQIKYSLRLPLHKEIEYSFNFTVPEGYTDQIFDIMKLSAKEERCK